MTQGKAVKMNTFIKMKDKEYKKNVAIEMWMLEFSFVHPWEGECLNVQINEKINSRRPFSLYKVTEGMKTFKLNSVNGN